MADSLKLNLACGDDVREGYQNLDQRSDPPVDVRFLTGIEDNSVDEIVAQDILEHFPREQTQGILREWYRVLRPGGIIKIRVPNLPVLAAILLAPGHSMTPELVIENIYGGHRWGPEGSLDAHHTGWTPATLKAELEQAGFHVIAQDEQPNFYTTAVRA